MATRIDDPLEGFEEIGLGMSNFDHETDEGFEQALRAGKVFGRHAAWSFNGRVWFDGQQFCEEVWVCGVPREIMRADSLRELMDTVNSQYGND